MTRTLAILLPVLALAACTVTSPDGVEFPKGAREAEVRARLGEPDFKEEFEEIPGLLNPVGRPAGFDLYYLDRGYMARLFNERLGRFHTFNPAKRGELETRARIYRDVVPLVPAGGSPADVVAVLGSPDLIEREMRKNTFYVHLPGGSPWPPSRSIQYCYLNRELRVFFEDDRVSRATPLPSFSQQYERCLIDDLREQAALAAQDPPRPGMAEAEVRKRWSMPPVVSGIVRSHEILTLPGEAAQRLGTEVTRWYYPAQDSIVHLRGGVVASIEPLDSGRKQLVTSFLEHADRIGARIGRTAEKRLD